MSDDVASESDQRKGVAATGSVIGALLASSCCVGPLVLIAVGASGPWIGKLTAFKAYQPLFVTLTVGFLGYGFWSVYRKDQQPCDGDSCTTPISDRMVKIALWTATVLVVAAVTTEYWAPLFY